MLHGFPGRLPRRFLLHGCAGAIRGFATWISWGNLKDVLLEGFLEVLLGGYRRTGERFAEWLSWESERDLLHACLERARERFGRDEDIWWLLSHVLCAR